jgi:hypothetical protein
MSTEKLPHDNKTLYSFLSFWLVPIITVLALLLGWVLKSSIESQSQILTHDGIQASFPAGWVVETGLPSDQMVFSAKEPLNIHHRYITSLVPSSPDLSLAGIAFTRNLERAQHLNIYKVLDQTDVLLHGQNAYKLRFAYVKPNGSIQIPTVIQGVEYFIPTETQTLLISMEQESEFFDSALPRFMDFLASISYDAGENQ